MTTAVTQRTAAPSFRIFLAAAAAFAGLLTAPALAQDTGAQDQGSAPDLAGKTYHHCSDQTDSNNRKVCTEYQLRDNGQAIRLFWRWRQDTGNIENHSITHRAWRVIDGKLSIQGEQQRYGQDSILYYDIHAINADGTLTWEAREVDGDGGTETEILDDPRVYKAEAIATALFAERLRKDSRFSRPERKNYVPEVYVSEVVSEYPARYLRD